jgi:hypothetical protein
MAFKPASGDYYLNLVNSVISELLQAWHNVLQTKVINATSSPIDMQSVVGSVAALEGFCKYLFVGNVFLQRNRGFFNHKAFRPLEVTIYDKEFQMI